MQLYQSSHPPTLSYRKLGRSSKPTISFLSIRFRPDSRLFTRQPVHVLIKWKRPSLLKKKVVKINKSSTAYKIKKCARSALAFQPLRCNWRRRRLFWTPIITFSGVSCYRTWCVSEGVFIVGRGNKCGQGKRGEDGEGGESADSVVCLPPRQPHPLFLTVVDAHTHASLQAQKHVSLLECVCSRGLAKKDEADQTFAGDITNKHRPVLVYRSETKLFMTCITSCLAPLKQCYNMMVW